MQRVRGLAQIGWAGLLPFLFLFTSAEGCRGPTADPDLIPAEEAEALGLTAGARLHRVSLGGRGAEEHAVPTVIRAYPGDGVEFLSVDHRVHTLEFVTDSLAREVREFLEATGQIDSPPLVSRGNRFILNLKNAPVGRYFFLSEGHGGTARGVIEVGLPFPADSSITASS